MLSFLKKRVARLWGKGLGLLMCVFFAIKDSMDRRDIEIQHCPTEEMVGDFQTKTLRGMKFKKFRNLILGMSLNSSCVESQ